MKKKETKEDMQAAENFFKEVSADVKSDNMKKLWDTYGLQIIIAVVIILTIAVSFETLKAWKLKHNESRSDAYSVALALQNQRRYDESWKKLKKTTKAFTPTSPKFKPQIFYLNREKPTKRLPFWKKFSTIRTLTKKCGI